ncbi:unnamed protein product [Linum tenue]|uniref:Uncharacterized protein n=1 Tax=Linum tenue TaxID=586396 RepID=A0AAV0NTJ0_9ROSI|nr:unnamed protein product [Linum tenue]
MNLEGAEVADLVDDVAVAVVEDGELHDIGGEEGGSRGGGAERGDWEKKGGSRRHFREAKVELALLVYDYLQCCPIAELKIRDKPRIKKRMKRLWPLSTIS